MAKRKQLVDYKAEATLLGALLRSPDAYFEASAMVRADFFDKAIHREIYTALAGILEERASGFSLVALQSRLSDTYEDGEDNEVDTAAYIAALIHNAEGVDVEATAADVASIANRRRLLKSLEKARDYVVSGERAPLDIASTLQEEALDVMRATSTKRAERIGTLARKAITTASRAQQGGKKKGFTTGLMHLDEIMGLILPGDLGFVMGAQGDGKTALAMQIGGHVSETYGEPVLVFSYELTAEQIAAREIARRSGVPARRINEGSFEMGDTEPLANATSRLDASKLYVIDDAKLSIRGVRSHALALKKTVGLSLVIIDHLRLIKNPQIKDKFERIENATSELRALSKDLDCAVMCLVQRTRFGQRRDDAVPHIDDAESPAVEQDADWVLAVWSEAAWLQRNRPEGKSLEAMENWKNKLARVRGQAKMMMLKHRRNEPFHERMFAWDGKTTGFSTWTGQQPVSIVRKTASAPPPGYLDEAPLATPEDYGRGRA